MAVRTITVGGALGLVLACTLPLDGKTACHTSQDCVDARACVDEQCRDGACDVFCTSICDAADDCTAITDCEDRCFAGSDATPPLVPTLDAQGCADAYDGWATRDACESLDCVESCSTLCTFADSMCGIVVDPAACFVGCLARNEVCSAAMPTTCADLPTDVLCWEDADVCQ